MKTIAKQDIINGLLDLGLKSSDEIEVHSSLSSFGYVEGGAETVISALKEAVGENDARAYSLFIKKYGAEKYTDTIISLINKGYDYPKQFKDINDVNEILEIFEKEK